jgi:hypothetical protein
MYNLLIAKSFTFEVCFQLSHSNNAYNYFDINTLTINIQNFVKSMMSIDIKVLNRKEVSF